VFGDGRLGSGVKNLNGSEAIPKYMFLISYHGEKDAFSCLEKKDLRKGRNSIFSLPNLPGSQKSCPSLSLRQYKDRSKKRLK
jgi:hypothetical protein